MSWTSRPCGAYSGQSYGSGNSLSAIWSDCTRCGWAYQAHQQLSLSDPEGNHPGFAPKGRATSSAAALRVAPRSGTQRRKILDYVVAHEPCTDEAIQEALGLSGNTERPRRVELVEGGWLTEYGQLGKTGSGAKAILWALTSEARTRLALGMA